MILLGLRLHWDLRVDSSEICCSCALSICFFKVKVCDTLQKEVPTERQDGRVDG